MKTIDSSKIEKALKRGNHSLSNEKSVSSLRHYWAWAHKSAKLLGSRRGPSNPQMGHSSAPVMHFQHRVQPGWFSATWVPHEPCIALICEGLYIRNRPRRPTCWGYSSCLSHKGDMWVVHSWAGPPYFRNRIISMTRSSPGTHSVRSRGSNYGASSWRWVCRWDRQHIPLGRSQTLGCGCLPSPWVSGVSQVLMMAKRVRCPCFRVESE